MSEKISELAHKFKEGIEILLNFIEKECSTVYESLKEGHERLIYKLQYTFFIELTKKSWFKDNVKEIEIPVSSMNITSGEIETRLIKKVFIIEEILNLFEEIFPITFKRIFTISEHNMLGSRRIKSEELFYQAFYKIFHGHLNEGLDVEVVLDLLIRDWSVFLSRKRMPIELKIDLRQIVFSGDLKEDDHFKMVHVFDLLLKSNDNISSQTFSGPVYTTFITPVLYNTEKENEGEAYQNNYRNQIQQYLKIHHELKKFLTCIYLKEYEISTYIPQIEHPWWSPYRNEMFLNKKEESYYSPRDWPKRMDTRDFKDILLLYDNLKKNDFFHEKCFPLTRSLMELALSRKSDIDRVFDAHVFLEFLFGPGDQGELSFRVSMNASLLISKNFTEFEKKFYFFRKLYNIRSTAIHGGDWLGHSEKIRKKLNDKGWKFSKINDMFGMIETIIRIIIEKLITLNVNAVQFRNNVNKDPLFFIKMAKFINKANEVKS